MNIMFFLLFRDQSCVSPPCDTLCCNSYLHAWALMVPGCGLTHWGQVTHICVSRLTIIGSDNGLPPDQHQAIIWTNAGILLIGPLGTNFSEILIEIYTFSFRKMHLKMSSGKWRPFCLGLNVLRKVQLLCTPLKGTSSVRPGMAKE